MVNLVKCKVDPIHYQFPVHLQPAYKELKLKNGSFPIAEKISSQILSLPMYPELEENEVKYICKNIKEFLSNKKIRMTAQNKIKNSEGLVVKGGGIVAKKDGDKIYILMVYRGNHNDWSFPKGHTENGETIQETVIREVEEESGIKSEILKELAPNKYFNPNGNEEVVCYMYLLKSVSGKIKPENEGDKVEWVPLTEVSQRISYSNLRNYFLRVFNDIVL